MRIQSILKVAAMLSTALVFNACSTQVAVNSNAESVATFRNGVFYGQVKGDYQAVFRAVNKSLDELGYMRVGEIPERTAMTVVARGIGDIRIEVRISRSAEKPGVFDIRIAAGRGDLPPCQNIFNKISANL